MKKYSPCSLLCALTILIFFINTEPVHAALSCSLTTAVACTSPSVVVLRMSSSTNAHAEMPSQSTAAYSNNAVCCSGVTGLSNSCVGSTTATVVNLASTTNSHAEESQINTFSNKACLSAPSGTLTIAYSTTTCAGYDTTLASLAAISNSHVGSSTAYTNLICGRYLLSQSISFSISANSTDFGTLSSVAARYATVGAGGSSSQVVAHTFTVASNASSGYTIAVQGATLSAASSTIKAIGGTNTASAPGSSQFGLNLSASGGTGAVSAPYSGSGFAYAATATTSSAVASESVGDSVNTVYSATYLANILPSVSAGNYSTTITYVVTGNF